MIEILNQAHDGQAVVCTIKGRIDTLTSPTLEEHLQEILNEGICKITLDMQYVDYISSAGLRVFLSVAKKLHKSMERLTLRAMNPQVKEVFDISGLTDFFNVT